MYFTASSLREGKELWKTNGTPAGTVLVKDINPGICPSDVGYLAAMGGKLYFTANYGIHGAELWQSDGTAPGTQMVTDLYAGTPGAYPVDLTPLNGKLYFIASGYTAGRELWSFDPNLPEENTPTLTITKTGDQVNISWPAAYQNWNPEVSATLRPGSWVQSFQPVTIAGGTQTFSVPVSESRFYRLRKN